MDVEVLEINIPFFFSFIIIITLFFIMLRMRDIYDYFTFGTFIYFLIPHLLWIEIIPGISLSFSNTASLIIFSYALIKYKHIKIKKRKSRKLLVFFMNIYVFSSIVLPLIYIFILDSFNISFTQWLSRMFLPTLGLVVFINLISKLNFNEIFLNKIAKVLFIYSVVIIFDAIFGYILGGWKPLLEYAGGSTHRVSTLIAGGPDQTIRFLTLGLLSAYYLYKNKRKNLTIILFVLAIPVYFYSVTRGGYIIFLILLFLILFNSTIKYSFPFFILIIIIIPFSVTIFNYFSEAFFNIRGDQLTDTQTFESRIERWKLLIEFLSKYRNDFIFGTGINNFHKFIGQEYREYISPLISKSTLHNFFFDIITSTGVPGFIFVVAFFVGILFRMQKINFKNIKQFYGIAFTLIVIIMLMNISWNHIYILPLCIVLVFDSYLFETHNNNSPVSLSANN